MLSLHKLAWRTIEENRSPNRRNRSHAMAQTISILSRPPLSGHDRNVDNSCWKVRYVKLYNGFLQLVVRGA